MTDLSAWRLDGLKPAPLAPCFSKEEAQKAAAAGAEIRTLEEALAPCAALEDKPFEEASRAGPRGGAFLRVPAGVRLKEPVTLSFRHEGSGHSFPRCVVVLEEGAEASVVEEHVSNLPNGVGSIRPVPNFQNPQVWDVPKLRRMGVRDELRRSDVRDVSDGSQGQASIGRSPTASGGGTSSGVISVAFSRAFVGPHARLSYSYTQELPLDAAHFRHQRVELQRGASLLQSSVALGGALHRSGLDVELLEPGARSEVRAVLFGRGGQRFNTRTSQHHCAGRTASDLLFRAALAGKARSGYDGLIRIEADAAGSEAAQLSRSLMLSETVRADTTPILEILTDAVRCKHGASAGPLDPDQLFYLASRGFDPGEAARTLVAGFFEPILCGLPGGALAERLRPLIDEAILEVEHAP